MKLMFEESEASFEQELNEASGEKKYKIRGIWSSPGQKNRNGRVYPMSIWEREVATYQDVIKSGHMNCLMEYQHPPRTEVDPMEAVARTTKLWIENGYVMGEAVLLDNPKANQLKTLIDNGVKLAVSTRGVGKLGANGIVEEYKLICVDIVSQQSDHMAEMYGITEGILQDKEFDVNEKGDIVQICSKDKCLRENRAVVNEAVVSIFNKLFEEVKTEKLSESNINKNNWNKLKSFFKAQPGYISWTFDGDYDILKIGFKQNIQAVNAFNKSIASDVSIDAFGSETSVENKVISVLLNKDAKSALEN